jgi:hypothetical protein
MMNDPQANGSGRPQPDEAFTADEARKSSLILQARMLSAQGQADQAAGRFAEAAQVEESLAQRCAAAGLHDPAAIHLFSAASCLAQAGNFFRAILLCDELLARPGGTKRLRQEVRQYALTLRARRAQWYAGLSAAV